MIERSIYSESKDLFGTIGQKQTLKTKRIMLKDMQSDFLHNTATDFIILWFLFSLFLLLRVQCYGQV